MNRNNGIHWRNAANPRLRELALRQAWRFNSDMEDPEMEHDGSIDTVFGSTGATITLRAVTGEGAYTAYMNGHCTMLAYALHERTGLPFYQFSVPGRDKTGWVGHVALSLGDNMILDIMGVRSIAEVLADFPHMEAVGEMNATEFKSLLIGDAWKDDVLSYLDELEQLVTEDFADWLVEENRIPTQTL